MTDYVKARNKHIEDAWAWAKEQTIQRLGKYPRPVVGETKDELNARIDVWTECRNAKYHERMHYVCFRDGLSPDFRGLS